jgi:hypothetical protein
VASQERDNEISTLPHGEQRHINLSTFFERAKRFHAGSDCAPWKQEILPRELMILGKTPVKLNWTSPTSPGLEIEVKLLEPVSSVDTLEVLEQKKKLPSKMLTAFKQKYAEAGYATEVWVAAGELLLLRDKVRMAIICKKFCETEAGEIPYAGEMQYTDLKTFTTKCWKDNIAIADRAADSLKAFGESQEDGKGWKSMEGLCHLVDQRSAGIRRRRQKKASEADKQTTYWFVLTETKLQRYSCADDTRELIETIALKGSMKVTPSGRNGFVINEEGLGEQYTFQTDDKEDKEARRDDWQRAIERNVEVINHGGWLKFQHFIEWTGTHEGAFMYHLFRRVRSSDVVTHRCAKI